MDNFEDERLKFNKYRAGSIAFRLCLLIAFALSVLSFLQPNLTFVERIVNSSINFCSICKSMGIFNL
ncbi:hypothetical protein UT300013_16650 [Paraclostridium sordellii]